VRSKKRLPLESLQPFILETPRADPANANRIAPLNWSTIFGNHHPVEIEVGFGKGGWLVSAAEQRQDVNFLGIEIMKALQLYAATRLAIRGLSNARIACTDAKWLLTNCVAAASVAAVHVYFPDPWWKARHKKRRVFSDEFAAAVERALIPGGQLHIATDVEEYFGVMTELVAARPAFREIGRRIDDAMTDAPMTNFERKAIEKGGRVWRAEYLRP
jgi:tRNA (guanine-N7-)-methyltransferase